MAPLGQLSPASKCDRYEIVRLIGAGGMGEVYQALHEFTKKPVALKILKVSHATKENLVEKMRAEAMVLCRIRHPNLVEVYDAGIADVVTAETGLPVKLIWMAMELLEGESLRERLLREGAIRPELALEWAAQVADGLQEAHGAQVVHRDLKPENVFLTKKGQVRVLDFGTAKFEGFGHARTKHTERMGTVPYMSPEHLADTGVDPRSDVFSLGIILYEMLAGRHPFAHPDGSFPSVGELIPMMLAGQPASLAPFVGDSIWQLVARAIERDRAARFGSMRELAQALRAARAQLTGSDRTGPVRLGSGQYPPTAPLPTPATPVAASRVSQATPPPITSSGRHARPPQGVTGGALAAMAVAAAAIGALVVVLVMRPGRDDEALADEPAPSAEPAAASPAPPASTSSREEPPASASVAPGASVAPSASAPASAPASPKAAPPPRPPPIRPAPPEPPPKDDEPFRQRSEPF